MQQVSKVFLIGFMGSGKTTAGRQLAALMNYQFIDLDELIEMNEHATISELFEMKGEKYFREKEATYLKSLSERKDIIVATGGGTPCFYDNMEWMKDNGTTVYLKLSAAELFERLTGERDHRPLLKGKTDEELNEFITTKLSEREQYYLLADHIIFPDKEMVERIFELVSRP